MSIAMRDALGQALVNIGKTDDKLVVLDADVSGSTKTGLFGQAYPDRFYNVGVAEANMAGMAAGMATAGYKPVISAFAIFLALKSTDQIRNVICYNNLPVVIAGGYAGLSDSFDGASHQSITDLAIMRAFPNMKVVVPGDSDQVEDALAAALNEGGPVYLRLCRNPTPALNSKEKFAFGKADVVKEGTDVTLASCGITLATTIEAAAALEKDGVSAEVLNLASVKPMDAKTIIASASKTGKVLTIEEHSVIGGMGSAVAEILAKNKPVPMDFIGVEDTFTESGPYDLIMNKYGMGVDSIVKKAKELASR